MAKGQKRSNKEVKKPKAAKKPAVEPATSAFSKGTRNPVQMPKKK